MLQSGTILLLRYFKKYDIVLSPLMSFQYVKNCDIPWLCSKDPFKEVRTREGFFSSFLWMRLQFFRYGNKEIHNIFIK